MAATRLSQLLAARRELNRLYLVASNPGDRVRIDAFLVRVEERLVQMERAQRLAALARLPQRLRAQAALLADLRNLAAGVKGRMTTAVVERAVDGDTVMLVGGARVRYIGMDAPELNNGPFASGQAEPYSCQAQAANADMVAGKTIRLLPDRSEQDRYGRLLRYVFCGDVFVNAQLVLDGWAEAYPLRPDLHFADLIVRCEDVARRQHAGRWRRGAG